MQSDNMEPCSEDDVKQVIEQTLENAGLRGVSSGAMNVPATNVPATEEPDPEMDEYLAKFETLANMTAAAKRACEETAMLTYLSTGDKQLMRLVAMQNELLETISSQLVAMNNIFGRE